LQVRIPILTCKKPLDNSKAVRIGILTYDFHDTTGALDRPVCIALARCSNPDRMIV
jgi:hypothetical protein